MNPRERESCNTICNDWSKSGVKFAGSLANMKYLSWYKSDVTFVPLSGLCNPVLVPIRVGVYIGAVYLGNYQLYDVSS